MILKRFKFILNDSEKYKRGVNKMVSALVFGLMVNSLATNQVVTNDQSKPQYRSKEISVVQKEEEVIGLTDPRAIERRIFENQQNRLNQQNRSNQSQRSQQRSQTTRLADRGSSSNDTTQQRNTLALDLYDYLARGERIEYNRLYQKFKSNPKLRKSQSALKRTLAFYVKHKDRNIKCDRRLRERNITNENYILLTDYTIPHPENRFFILDLRSGEVVSSPVSHGYGSNHRGSCPSRFQVSCGSRGIRCLIPVRMGNTRDSGKTSRGFYITAEPYRSRQRTFKAGDPSSKSDNAIRLDGLEYKVNHRARSRAVVFHRASYYKNSCSSSAGCPAISPVVFETYKQKLYHGTLLYIYTIEDKNIPLPKCTREREVQTV